MTNYFNESNPVVTLYVKDMGEIKLELFEAVAPNTVRNFISLVEKRYYDGLIFHRIIPGFMVQGGGSEKKSCAIAGEFKSNGFDNPLNHTRGVISMARTSDPNSQTSQFFIMHKDAPHLDGAYAAFGAVIDGIEVVDQIAIQPRDRGDKPLQDVVIEKMTIDLKGKTYSKPVCYK
jgi:peptidyl-prolyl cis-trans isomerase B (cyclophilin B)